MKFRELALEERCKKILGLASDAHVDLEQLRAQFREKAKSYHPDTNRSDSSLNVKFMLILQDYNYLRGDSRNTGLLEDTSLVERLLSEHVEELGKSYQEWLIDRFYDREGGTIWP